MIRARPREVLLRLQSLDVGYIRQEDLVLSRKIELFAFRLREVIEARPGVACPSENILSLVDRLPEFPLTLAGVPVS